MTEPQYINKKIKPYLVGLGVLPIKIHGGPFSEVGTPDLLCCYKGRFLALEVKQRGNTTTLVQDLFLRRIREAGGVAGVIYTDTYKEDISTLVSQMK
jgi:hypothetical protein